MTTKVSIDDYCLDPTKYLDILPDLTVKYWDQICDGRKSSKDQNKGTSIADLGKAIPAGLQNMAMGFLTPENLGILAGFMGVSVISKKLFTFFVDKIATKFSEEMAVAIAEMAEDGLSSAAINASAMLTTILDRAIIDDLGDAGIYALGALLKGAEMFADLIPGIGEVMMMLQLLSTVFDAWDPYHLNDQLNSETISEFNINFDKVFRENMLVSVESFIDPYGNIYMYQLWPVDFYADNSILANEREDKYSPLRAKYMTKWLNSRDINSYGQLIYWPSGGILVNNSILSKLERNIAVSIADNNTVVGSWIVRYMPIILIVIAILIFIIFVLIK